jgi:outer membrane receptor protein involved in Fe transport
LHGLINAKELKLKTPCYLLLLLLSTIGYSQDLIIKDAATFKSIPDVLVYNRHVSEISDIRGMVSLSNFSTGDTLYFQHPSYNTAKLYLSTTDETIEFELIEKSIKLDEIVVSVSRWAESSAEFPNKVVGLTTNDIEFYNPQTTADALAETGEIFVQKSQLGGGSPMIRGFAANRILLTVDGIRLNNAIYRSGNLQNIISIDANSLERTEVIFGPGSVQYGSDALGGVVNMMTKTTEFSTDGAIINGSSLLRYSTANNERTAHIDLSYSAPRFASVTSISYSKYGDLQMGSNGRDEYLRSEYVTSVNGTDVVVANENVQKQVFTGFAQYSFIQKLKFKLNEYLVSEAGFYYSNTDIIPRYDRLIQYKNGNLRYANWYYGPQEWLMGKIDIAYAKTNALMDKAKLQLAYQQANESRHDRDFGSSIRRNRYESVNIFSINLDFTKPLNNNHHLYYGFNAGFNKVSSTASALNINNGNKVNSATRYPDGSVYNNYAVYLNYEYKPSEKLNFLAGLRYSLFYLSATFDTTFYPFPFTSTTLNPSAPSGSIGVVLRPNRKTTLQANASSAFRAPNIDDVGKVFDSEPGNVVVPNPDLSPEYAFNLDLGISQRFGQQVKIDFTGFYTFLENAMVRRDFSINGQDSIIYDGELSKVQALVNTGSAYLYGFNAKLFIDFSENWSATSTFNLVKGEDEQHLPLRHITPAFGSTHLLYKRNRLKLDLSTDYSAGFSYNQLAPEEQSKPHIYAIDENGKPFSPGWVTINLMSSMQLWGKIQLNLGIENILDNRYKTYSSGLVAPGRNLVIGLRGYF